jgi:hypothetical protein
MVSWALAYTIVKTFKGSDEGSFPSFMFVLTGFIDL